MEPIITVAQAAVTLACAARTVARVAALHGIGIMVTTRFRALTAADVERLRPLIRPGPGNPEFGKSIRGRQPKTPPQGNPS